MSRVVVFTSVTLDGVMQAPGRPDEDPRDGFRHGGWALPYNDPVMARVTAEGMANAGPLLLGRRTYEDFFSFWPQQQGNPFTEVLDNTLKYVASTTLQAPLPWSNSALLEGDAADIHPLVLGSGRRLFPDGGAFTALRLVDSVTTTAGVIIATYRPAERSSG